MKLSRKLDMSRVRLGRLAAAGMLFVLTAVAQNPAVVASDAWARVPAPSKSETALYMVLENRSGQPRAVVSATSPAATKIEMHEMKMMTPEAKTDPKMPGKPSMTKSGDQGMMVMLPVTQIAVPAKGKTPLAPNGFHMMLFGLKSRLAAGDKLAVTLKLDDGTTVPVTAEVRQ